MVEALIFVALHADERFGVYNVAPRGATTVTFLARTLLIHNYRRIVLKEPELPAGLWPPDWIGVAAYDVAARCYHALAGPAEASPSRDTSD